jgi:acyl-CoA thioesterase
MEMEGRYTLIRIRQRINKDDMTPNEFFKNDRFATEAGIELIEIKTGYGKAQLTVGPQHLNAGNTTQGGAIFTLADLALAAAANSYGTLALSLTSSITFLRSSRPGDMLTAEAWERYAGRKTGHYQVDVTNQYGQLVATFEASVYRTGDELPFVME